MTNRPSDRPPDRVIRAGSFVLLTPFYSLASIPLKTLPRLRTLRRAGRSFRRWQVYSKPNTIRLYISPLHQVTYLLHTPYSIMPTAYYIPATATVSQSPSLSALLFFHPSSFPMLLCPMLHALCPSATSAYCVLTTAYFSCFLLIQNPKFEIRYP